MIFFSPPPYFNFLERDMFTENDFVRSRHVFHSEAFAEIIKDTIRFFNGTPIQHLPPSENFIGAGVYALYYTGNSPYYVPLYVKNRINFVQPIYVGKAVPRGWRQARCQEPANELYLRLCDHFRSINKAVNLEVRDFHCRFMILEDAAADMIGTVESALIREYMPVWNSAVDGFGNHDPGSGRYMQARSDWDVLHPGREWASRCKGAAHTIGEVEQVVSDYFRKRNERH